MFEIIREDKFLKIAKKFLKKHPDLVQKFKQTVQKLENDPFEPSLKLHKLQGNLEKFHAVRLTYEYRIVLVIDDYRGANYSRRYRNTRRCVLKSRGG